LGVYPVEVMPWLDHLPDFMSSWRVMSKKLYLDTIKLYSGLAKDVRRKIKEGTAEQCLCQELWDEQKQNGLDDDVSDSVFFSVKDAKSFRDKEHSNVVWRDARSWNRYNG